jgi:hypothetical protein
VGQINLPRLDPPPVEYEDDLSTEMGIWLSDVSDAVNSAFQTLESNLSPTILNIGGSGAGPIDISYPEMSINSIVIVNLISSTNPVTITNVTPTTNKFTVTFSGDPGTSAIISYIAFI